MKKEILKFGEPRVRCYQHYAFPTGIMSVNMKNMDYIYNLFISLVYKSDKLSCIEFNLPYFLSMDGLFISGYVMYPKEYVHDAELIEMVKKCINNGIYVTGLWNEFYVPQKHAYQRYNFVRNYLIYGYDDATGCFESAGYIGQNTWGLFKVSYSDFLQALMVVENFIRFNTYIYNNDFNKTADFKRISNDMTSYLESERLVEESEYSFGIQANRDYFANLIEIAAKNKRSILPTLFALYEHKCLMYDRLSYLSLSGMVNIPENVMNEYRNIPLIYRNLLNRTAKYNLTEKKEILERIVFEGNESVELEEKLLSSINFK